MMSLSRMIPIGLIAVGLSTSGCSTWPAPFDNQARTADGDSFEAHNADHSRANKSVRLAEKRGTKPGDASDHYTNQRIAMVARPARYSASELARVEVWWTDNSGFHWHKAGRFEQGQAFFPLDVKEDGDYGVRFVGPGEEPAQRVLAFPERTYHVDTVRPEVQVLVDPVQAEYHVGDLVTIDWMVQDFQLERFPVTIEVLLDRHDADTGPIEVQRDLPEEGSVTYGIPPEALGRELTFRVEARDRTGNLGLAYTNAIRVVEDPMAAALAKTEMEKNEIDATDEAVAVAVVEREPQSGTDDDAPIEPEDMAPVVGPILIPVENDAQSAAAAATVEAEPITAAVSESTGSQERRAAREAKLARAAIRVAEFKRRATMLTSQVVERVGDVVDGWVASAIAAENQRAINEAKLAEAAMLAEAARLTEEMKSRATVLVSQAVDVVGGAVDGWVTSAKLARASAKEMAAVKSPAPAAVATIEAEETTPRTAGSTFLEIGPQIVMAEDLFEEEPAADLPPPREPAIEANNEATDSTPDQDAPRSSNLPFATAIARLPAIDTRIMDEVAPAADLSDDGTTSDGTDHTEPSPEDYEQLADTVVTASTDEMMDDQEPAMIQTAASDAIDNEEPFLPAVSIESMTTVDPTQGNGLLIPMPATVVDGAPTGRLTAHPWRTLGRRSDRLENTIWTLPQRQSDVAWRAVFTDRQPTDDPGRSTLAGTSEDVIDGAASDEP